MSIRSRAVVTAAFGCVPLVLMSACGDGGGTANGARSTLQYVPATNYVVKEPPTTTTTTSTVPGEQAGGTAAEEEYEIQSGDGLFAIANEFGVEMEAICEYNQWDQCGGDVLLLPGETILIPPRENVASAGADDGETAADDGETAAGATAADDTDDTDSIDEADETDDGSEDAVACEHTIVEGDNPGRVAGQYDITVEELNNANLDNSDYSWFPIGGSLNIPAGGSC